MDHVNVALGSALLLGVALCALFAFFRVGEHRAASALTHPPGDTFDSFISTRYFSGLDGLRAISVIGVIWSHVTSVNVVDLLNQGNKGVDLFFAISGFLVTTLLLREYRRDRRISLRDFYIRRTLRIFPLYYAVLGLYCLLVFLTLSGTPKANEFWSNLPAFATYTSNWFVNPANEAGHGVTFYFAWSLATEEQFYLLWPALMVFLLLKLENNWALFVAALALVGVQALAADYGRGTLLGVILGSLAPAILLGAALAVLLNLRWAFRHLYPFLGNRWTAPAAALLLLAMLQLDTQGIATRLVMAVLVASVCMREDTWLHPLLRLKAAVLVGTISYGVYLMHMLAANVVRKFLGHAMGVDVFIATTLLSIVVAYLSFRYFERPILELKGRLTGRPRQNVAAAPLMPTSAGQLAPACLTSDSPPRPAPTAGLGAPT